MKAKNNKKIKSGVKKRQDLNTPGFSFCFLSGLILLTLII